MADWWLRTTHFFARILVIIQALDGKVFKKLRVPAIGGIACVSIG